MTHASEQSLLTDAETALEAVAAYAAQLTEAVRARIAATEPGDLPPVDRHQRLVHGLAWIATLAAGLRALHDWAARVHEHGGFTEREQLVLALGFGEYLAQ